MVGVEVVMVTEALCSSHRVTGGELFGGHRGERVLQ